MNSPVPIFAHVDGLFAAMAIGMGLCGAILGYQLGKHYRRRFVSVFLVIFLIVLFGYCGYLLGHLFVAAASLPIFFFLGAYAEKHFQKREGP